MDRYILIIFFLLVDFLVSLFFSWETEILKFNTVQVDKKKLTVDLEHITSLLEVICKNNGYNKIICEQVNDHLAKPSC